MRELETILEQYNSLRERGIACVLATVVHVEGSSYRRAGARMLVDEIGNITGAISGGCLEGDALRKALHALHQDKNKLVTYDTSDEDDAIIGAQLGCNGIIQVLFEPIDFDDEWNPCELLKLVMEKNRNCAILVEFNLDKSETQAGTTGFIDEELNHFGREINKDWFHLIRREAEIVLETSQHSFADIQDKDKQRQVFIQYHQPAVKLVLVGAGNDALILSQQADLLGWDVVVADGRSTHANKDRFASSCQVIVSKPELTLDTIKMDQRTCFVLMSHNYNYDLAVLKLLKDHKGIPYIGILGPRKKYDRMLDDLEKDGFELSNEFLEKVHAPVGLEIGAETPAEIGLSILAEIQSVLTHTRARPLREKQGPIHEKEGNEFKEVSL